MPPEEIFYRQSFGVVKGNVWRRITGFVSKGVAVSIAVKVFVFDCQKYYLEICSLPSRCEHCHRCDDHLLNVVIVDDTANLCSGLVLIEVQQEATAMALVLKGHSY